MSISAGCTDPGWASCQAATQFQGEGYLHKMAALMLTETVQLSKKNSLCTFVDAMSV